MKKFEIKTLPIYILLIIFLLFANTIGYKNYNTLMNYAINPIFWLIIFCFSIWVNSNFNQRIKFQSNKLQTIFIIVTIYLIIYFISGLFLGYAKNIYNTSFLGVLKNIWIYLIPIIFIEYTRKTLVTNNKGIVNDILVTILFSLIGINILATITSDYTTIFKNISSTLVPALTSSVILLYLSKTCGYYGNLFYRIPQVVITISLPILPSLDWYYTALFGILLPVVVFIFIKHINKKIESTESKRELRKKSSLKLLFILIPVLLIIFFVAGLFKYKPTSILSNSMHPIFDRGDVIVTQKINKNNLNIIKKYDIIEYILDNTIVAHRIINIEEHNDGSKLYTTMGDNNNAPDIKKVKDEQILGKVIFRIPKVGYPSVWLNEFFNKNRKATVETGK